MRVEIERKFLVAHEGWRAASVGQRRLRDGLIAQSEAGKVRVRLDETRAWITVKGARRGLARPEFEYEVPHADGEALLREVCVGCLIEKTRYCVPHDGLIWEVDVFEGELAGIILAEVELEREDQVCNFPEWLGREVTGDSRFRQSTLLRLCGEVGRELTVAALLEQSIKAWD